ncbi:hypothetical protein Bca4012_086849 [Brassica carinata]
MSLTTSILQLGSSLISAKVRRRCPSWRLAEKLLCDCTETASRTSRPFSSQSLSHRRETKCYLQTSGSQELTMASYYLAPLSVGVSGSRYLMG